VKDLRAQFGRALVSSRHSKLAIGAAIERLLAAPGGVGLMAGDRLTPAGYARVDALLSAEPAPTDAG
jgi:hypothetical protein